MGRNHTVIGVDPSSRKIAAVASTPDGGWLTFTSEVDESTAKQRGKTLGYLFNEFLDWLRDLDLGAFFLFVEQPLFGRNVNTMRVISQVESLVLLAAHEQDAQGIYEVNVQVWKKDVVGQGNASKGDVKSYLQEHHDDLSVHLGDDQDLFDAGAVCLYGLQVIVRGENLAA